MCRLHFKEEVLFFTIITFLFAILFGVADSKAVTVTLSCGPDPGGGYAGPCQQIAEDWATKTGNQVKMFYLPGEANDQLAIYQQLFAAKHTIPDVIRVDVIWPGLLQQYLLDLSPIPVNESDSFTLGTQFYREPLILREIICKKLKK